MISVLWKKKKKTLFDLYTLKINWALHVHRHLAISLVTVDGAQHFVRHVLDWFL